MTIEPVKSADFMRPSRSPAEENASAADYSDSRHRKPLRRPGNATRTRRASEGSSNLSYGHSDEPSLARRVSVLASWTAWDRRAATFARGGVARGISLSCRRPHRGSEHKTHYQTLWRPVNDRRFRWHKHGVGRAQRGPSATSPCFRWASLRSNHPTLATTTEFGRMLTTLRAWRQRAKSLPKP
jgi:hypothetical protein